MKNLSSGLKKSRILIAGMFMAVAVVAFAGTYALTNDQQLAATSECADTCVSLKSDKAYPDTVTVTPGSYVQFNSADGNSHSLSLGQGGHDHAHHGKFSSGTFGADEGWRVQFKEEGSFVFHDHMNPEISVLVVVYTPGKTYKVE